MLIPLFAHDEADIQNNVEEHAIDWHTIRICSSATYLGFMVGPKGTAEANWAQPLLKYLDRCEYVRELGQSHTSNVTLYSVFAASVVQCVAQLHPPPHCLEG